MVGLYTTGRKYWPSSLFIILSPLFSDVYGLSDTSGCPLIFLGQYVGIVPIYIMIILTCMVWNSRFVWDGLWYFTVSRWNVDKKNLSSSASFWCSVCLPPNCQPVSPIYTLLHSLHGILYTTPDVSAGFLLSLGWTRSFLRLMGGLMKMLIVRCKIWLWNTKIVIYTFIPTWWTYSIA